MGLRVRGSHRAVWPRPYSPAEGAGSRSHAKGASPPFGDGPRRWSVTDGRKENTEPQAALFSFGKLTHVHQRDGPPSSATPLAGTGERAAWLRRDGLAILYCQGARHHPPALRAEQAGKEAGFALDLNVAQLVYCLCLIRDGVRQAPLALQCLLKARFQCFNLPAQLFPLTFAL